MTDLPERVNRAEILTLLEGMGFVPEEIAELTLTPTTVVVTTYDVDDAGRIAIDDDGEVVRHETHIPIA